MKNVPLTRRDLIPGRLVTTNPTSQSIWRVVETNTIPLHGKDGNDIAYVVLNAVRMDGYAFTPGENHTPQWLPSLEDVTLYAAKIED